MALKSAMQDAGGALGQAIAEVDGGSPRRGASLRRAAFSGALSGDLMKASALSLHDSEALQEDDVRDAKGQVHAVLLPFFDIARGFEHLCYEAVHVSCCGRQAVCRHSSTWCQH